MDITANTNSTPRIHKFRGKVQELGYKRFEIVASIQSIADLRAVAKAGNIPTYQAFEQAVKLLVEQRKSSVSGNNARNSTQQSATECNRGNAVA